jgi:phage shock protein A
MGIFSRLKTVISSNVNDLINKAENPEKMLNQLLIEMDGQLVESKKAVSLAIADEIKLKRAAQEQYAQAQKWEHDAMLAVNAGNDALAKEGLLRKQEADNAYTEYYKQWQAQKAAVEKLKNTLRDLQDKIDEARRKKNLLIARAKRAEAQQRIQNTISSVSGNTSAFEAFDRMSAKVDQLEAQADAQAELADLSRDADLDKQFRELEQGGGSADAMLLELKQKMGALPPAPPSGSLPPPPNMP